MPLSNAWDGFKVKDFSWFGMQGCRTQSPEAWNLKSRLTDLKLSSSHWKPHLCPLRSLVSTNYILYSRTAKCNAPQREFLQTDLRSVNFVRSPTTLQIPWCRQSTSLTCIGHLITLRKNYLTSKNQLKPVSGHSGKNLQILHGLFLQHAESIFLSRPPNHIVKPQTLTRNPSRISNPETPNCLGLPECAVHVWTMTLHVLSIKLPCWSFIYPLVYPCISLHIFRSLDFSMRVHV